MDPLISIIVPIYKVEKYIHRCIDSLLIQTYSNLEIILVDDGSPDSCGEICDWYALQDQRIKVVHKENGGLSDARNMGISVAQGEYIGFVDSDDYVEPEMFEKLWKALKDNNTKLSMCSLICEDENGEIAEYSDAKLIKDGVFNAEELLVKIVQTNGWFYIVAWNKLYHKSLLNDRFYPIGKYHEDEFVISQLLWNAKKIAYISDKEYHYTYKRSDSITGERRNVRHLDALEALYHRCLFYHEKKLDNLIFDNRTIFFRELEKNYFYDKKDGEYKKRLKELERLYEKIPGRRLNEEIRWKLFKISPSFEVKFMEFINYVRRR